MDIRIDSPVIEVHPSRLVSLQVGAGRHLTNVRGTAWITLDGDPRDVILEPGDSHTFERSGRAVVQALGGDAELVAEDGIEVDRDFSAGTRGRDAFGARALFGRLLAAGGMSRKTA